MATAAPARATPASRRSPPTTISSSASPPSAPIAKGPTPRSVASARAAASLNSPVARRQSIKTNGTPSSVTGETRESLSASLKEETEKKEKLLVQIQDKDTTITQLSTENDNLTSALSAAESRLQELYADQTRMEEEMAARMEVAEKLRTQVRELEKEKRDIQRRYNEQTATFEAERQAFYDNEQHLKSRIQSLTQPRAAPRGPKRTPCGTNLAHRAVAARETAANKPPPIGAASTANTSAPPKAKPAPAPVKKDTKKSLKGVLVKKKSTKPAITSPSDAQDSAAASKGSEKTEPEGRAAGDERQAKRRKVSAS